MEKTGWDSWRGGAAQAASRLAAARARDLRRLASPPAVSRHQPLRQPERSPAATNAVGGQNCGRMWAGQKNREICFSRRVCVHREEAWNGWSSMKCTCSGRQAFNSSMEVLRYMHRTDVAQMLPREQWAGFVFFRLSRGQVCSEQGNTRTRQHR